MQQPDIFCQRPDVALCLGSVDDGRGAVLAAERGFGLAFVGAGGGAGAVEVGSGGEWVALWAAGEIFVVERWYSEGAEGEVG